MTQWKYYKVVSSVPENREEEGQNLDIEKVESTNDENGRSETPLNEYLQNTLNELGEDGWELVAAYIIPERQHRVYYLKKPI